VIRRLEGPELAAYDVVEPRLAARVRIVKVPVLARGADAMTIGRWVLVRDDQDRRGTRELLAHELVHVRQYAERGSVRFLVKYLRDYLSELRATHNHHDAYLAIPDECEARREAAEWTQRRP